MTSYLFSLEFSLEARKFIVNKSYIIKNYAPSITKGEIICHYNDDITIP